MFTFGREHEIKVALRRYGGLERASQIVDIVNAIHDLQEGACSLADVESAIRLGLIEGRREIWDAAGTWLLKLQGDYPECRRIWKELAAHDSAEVRFRVASHLIDFGKDLRQEIYESLKNDKSKRVRSHVEAKWDYCQHPEKYA